MTISKEDIKKLADLARIEIDETEVENLSTEVDAILTYVGQVSDFADSTKEGLDNDQMRNVMREDENPTLSETYSKELIAEFPQSEKNYLKVKKIL